ncbi:hypothetical protein FRC03_000292 [Tulasnella sp. 419]|nr:hypothetical protein FRC03_000292 [Tulasnella sp. 419]
MIAQFALFIGVAVVCFSGLAFTLWRLSGPEWTIKKIIWLMVQIWFGNTYLSFNVAESFHPIFGPPIMIVYAALSNTLLITILISILSATFAKIDAHATEEYLFQFAISTLEGVNSDALFSYQPPFNIVAYLILGPAGFILSPRAFHTLNVFMIRATSFPILASITIYERYFAPGSKLIESGKGKAQAIFDSLPRQIRNVAVLEAIVGSASNDLLDAIFDVNVPEHVLGDADSVNDRGQEAARSEEHQTLDGMTTPPQRLAALPRGRFSVPSSPGIRQARSTSRSYLAPPDGGSPLQKLFAPSRSGLSASAADLSTMAAGEEVVTAMKRVEGMLDGVQDIQQLKTQMKETKAQLERIETLLLSLTRNARD